jgi:ribonucleotide reductase beta subunit family protein with ferritin-like domain
MELKPLMPPTRRDLFDLYERARGCLWFETEINYVSDLPDYISMNVYERHFIELILGFFAVSDRLVLSNLIENFIHEIEIPEAKLFYNFQAIVEDIHSMTYTNHLITLVRDPLRIDQLLNSIEHFPSISKKVSWAQKWMDPIKPLEQRLLAFAIVEAVYFCASFCAIFWLKTQNKLVKGVGTSNEYISRDEKLHADFACLLYRNYFPRVSTEIIQEMMYEALEIEMEFVKEILPGDGFIGMNSKLMCEYVRYVSDQLLVQMGEQKMFHVENPFSFMVNLNLRGKTNFFEKRVTEYAKISSSCDSLEVLDDF